MKLFLITILIMICAACTGCQSEEINLTVTITEKAVLAALESTAQANIERGDAKGAGGVNISIYVGGGVDQAQKQEDVGNPPVDVSLTGL